MHSVGLILMPRWYIYIQNGGNRNLQMKLSVWRDAGSSYKLFALLRSYTLLFLNPLRSWIAETFFWYEEIINKSICYWSFLLPPTVIAQLVAGLSGKHRTMLLHPLPSPNYTYVHDRVLVKKKRSCVQSGVILVCFRWNHCCCVAGWLTSSCVPSVRQPGGFKKGNYSLMTPESKKAVCFPLAEME